MGLLKSSDTNTLVTASRLKSNEKHEISGNMRNKTYKLLTKDLGTRSNIQQTLYAQKCQNKVPSGTNPLVVSLSTCSFFLFGEGIVCLSFCGSTRW